MLKVHAAGWSSDSLCAFPERNMEDVQVVTWVPQNDVLAHPNLKLFLSHCGVNSMYEVRTPSTWLLKVTALSKHLILMACDAPCVLLKLHSHKEEGAARRPSSAEACSNRANAVAMRKLFGAGNLPWEACCGDALLRGPAYQC